MVARLVEPVPNDVEYSMHAALYFDNYFTSIGPVPAAFVSKPLPQSGQASPGKPKRWSNLRGFKARFR